MARRRRGPRGSFRQVKPDMGWYVGSDTLQWEVPIGATAAAGDIDVVVTHDNLTGESVVQKDKSDWYVKRVLIDAFPTYMLNSEPGGRPSTDVARLWTLAVGVIDGDKSAEWLVNGGHTLNSALGYEMWARVFRMWTQPVYKTWTPHVIRAGGTYPADDQNTLMTYTSEGSTIAEHEYAIVGEPWGPARVRDDFEVSNAGIRPEQFMCVAISGEDGPGLYEWKAGEVLTLTYFIRVLLKKRIG